MKDFTGEKLALVLLWTGSIYFTAYSIIYYWDFSIPDSVYLSRFILSMLFIAGTIAAYCTGLRFVHRKPRRYRAVR